MANRRADNNLAIQDSIEASAPGKTQAMGLSGLAEMAEAVKGVIRRNALANPITAAQIEMYNDPAEAERSGLVKAMIAAGTHEPASMADKIGAPDTTPAFDRARSERIYVPQVEAITVEGASTYITVKGSLPKAIKIVNGANILEQFQENGSKVIAVEKPLFKQSIVALGKIGAICRDAKGNTLTA